jgi:hypothetical protein
VDFLGSFDCVPAVIRKSVEFLSWKNQMKRVVDEID